MLVGVRAGAFYDPTGSEGTAALVARVLDRGTTSRSATDIADELDGRGASLSVIAGRHQLTVSATCLAEDFDAIFALVADIVQHPRVRRARGRDATRRAAHGDPAGRRRSGARSPSTADGPAVSAIIPTAVAHAARRRPCRRSRATISSTFHRMWFTPEGTTVVVVGDVDAEEVVRAASREFGAWSAAASRRARCCRPSRRTTERDLAVVPMMNKAQADIAYGLSVCGAPIRITTPAGS